MKTATKGVHNHDISARAQNIKCKVQADGEQGDGTTVPSVRMTFITILGLFRTSIAYYMASLETTCYNQVWRITVVASESTVSRRSFAT